MCSGKWNHRMRGHGSRCLPTIDDFQSPPPRYFPNHTPYPLPMCSDIEDLVQEWMTEPLASFDPGYPGRAKAEQAAFKESEIAREIRIKEIMEEEMEEELRRIEEEMEEELRQEEAKAEEKAKAKAEADEV